MSDNHDGRSNDNQPTNQSTGYSKEYVSSLRDEAASWRTKYRDMETKIQEIEKTQITTTIKSVLDQKQIKCDPSWIKVEQGQTVDQAVDKFVELYPQFKSNDNSNNNDDSNDNTNMNRFQKPMNTNKENTNSNNRSTNKNDINSIRKDPIARQKIRDRYRTLLTEKNRQTIG